MQKGGERIGLGKVCKSFWGVKLVIILDRHTCNVLKQKSNREGQKQKNSEVTK